MAARQRRPTMFMSTEQFKKEQAAIQKRSSEACPPKILL
jgi:hypothetical protein